MRVADTSALFALFSVGDTHHGDAVEAIGDPEPVSIPVEIFAETLALIQLRQGFQAALAAGRFLRALPNVDLRWPFDDLLDAAWSIYQEGRGRLSYPDAVVAMWCRYENAAPLTFDKALRRFLRA